MCNRRRFYGGMDRDAAKELKELRDQNNRLKRLLADAELERRAEGDRTVKILSPTARRDAIDMLKGVKHMSERMSCRVGWAFPLRVSTLAASPTPPLTQTPLYVKGSRNYARMSPRHGFRRASAHLRVDDGIEVNKNKVHRLWRKKDYSAPCSARQTGPPIVGADHRGRPHQKCCVHWLFSSTPPRMGGKVKFASMVDEHTRTSLLNIVTAQSPPRR